MRIFLILSILVGSVLASDGLYDFEFRGMDFYQAVNSIAKLMKKNVLFSAAVENKPVVFHLSEASADVALKFLLETQGCIAVEKLGVLQIMPAGDRGIASTPTAVFTLKNVIAKDIENNIKFYLGDKGTMTVNEQLNALIVNATEDRLQSVQALVNQLDQEAPQIYIEAKIVETSSNYSRDFGIEWGSMAGTGGLLVSAPSAGSNVRFQTSAGVGSSSAIDLKLAAAETNGQARILSSPKITTLNGVVANLSSQRRYNIKVLSTSAASPGTNNTSSVTSISAGLTLDVTPFIVGTDQVRLNIDLVKSDPLDEDIDGLPQMADSKAKTSLVVRNRQTAALGGMLSNSLRDKNSGVPFLSTLPVLGMLFGNSSKKTQFNELLIFITPTIFYGSRGVTSGSASTDAPVDPPEADESASLNRLRSKPSDAVLQ